MATLPTRIRRLGTASRWPLGVAVTSWRYMWRTTPMHRSEAEGAPETDMPPPLPEGGPLFHVISGNLGYQVEHHLYPDMPSTRYGEIVPQVRQICERYGLPYNSGPFFQQWGMVQRTILRLAFPGGKPGPSRAHRENGDRPADRGVNEVAESMADAS